MTTQDKIRCRYLSQYIIALTDNGDLKEEGGFVDSSILLECFARDMGLLEADIKITESLNHITKNEK